jgi:eukaryotic-like serine/threonine-protein kinase
LLPDDSRAYAHRMRPPDELASGAGGDTTPEVCWPRVKAIFLETLDRADDERRAFVTEACGGDLVLEREVVSLLDSDAAAGSFCEVPAAARLGPDAFSGQPARRLAPGARVGAYEITGFLGAGGMGEVYRARDTRLRRDVAIKTLGTHVTDAAATRRLLKEARHASGLTHPNICTIYEVGEFDEVPFIAMAYAEGRTLRDIQRDRTLASGEIVAWGRQIAGAVAHAHGRGIIHRDLKASNIVINGEGQPIVLDFGLAKRLPAASGVSESIATHDHPLAGTLDYMAPEVLLGSPGDTRSDVWAIGVLLYEMAAGRLPFCGRTPFETSSAIIGDPIAPLRRAVPLALRLVIERCLAKDPARRYEHAGALAEALEAVERGGIWPFAGDLLRSTRRQVGYALASGLAIALMLFGATSERLRVASPPGNGTPVLAVLPVDNATGDPDAQPLADGMTDALIAQIGALGAARVISRTSAERVAGSHRSLAEIGRELGADTLVQAALQAVSGRIRMDVRVIEAASGTALWSDTFERWMPDVLLLQADVVRAVAAGLSLTIRPDARERLAMVRTVNPEAYEAYLKGRFEWNRRTQTSIQAAISHFTRAIELDPTYAPAHASLADCYNQLGTVMIGTGSPREYRPLAAAEAIKALQIDPHASEAHATLGYVRHYEWHWEEAEQAFRRAIELNPSYALARVWYANMLVSKQRVDEALREILAARDLDPFSPVVNTNVGWILQFAGRHADAAEQLVRTLELAPDYPQAHARLSASFAALQRYDGALSHAQRAVELTGRAPQSVSALAAVHAQAGQRDRAEALLHELLDASRTRYVPPFTIAEVYRQLDAIDAALDWLERAADEGSNGIAYLAVAGYSEPARAHPRFQALLERTRLD